MRRKGRKREKRGDREMCVREEGEKNSIIHIVIWI